MKRLMAIIALSAVALFSVSCNKEGPKRFSGNYTFKTSGTITVREAGNESAELKVVSLFDESGQMDVVESGKSEGGMLVAMNALGGSVVTFEAEASGKTLTITPFNRQLTVPFAESSGVVEVVQPVATVTVSGYAERYADALLFWLDYTGSFVHGDVTYEIVSSNVSCWAKVN